MPDSDVVVSVVFQKIAVSTISFDTNGGELDGKTGVITITAEMGSTITIPDAPTREGYTFTYWKGSEYYPGDTYLVEGDHTFTAQWEEGESVDEPIDEPIDEPGDGEHGTSENHGKPGAPTKHAQGKRHAISQTNDANPWHMMAGLTFMGLASAVLGTAKRRSARSQHETQRLTTNGAPQLDKAAGPQP